MLNRFGLERFKKALSTEPFSVNSGSLVTPSSLPPQAPSPSQKGAAIAEHPTAAAGEGAACQGTTVGNGQSTWQPPAWAVEPRQGVYWLEVVKDGEVLDNIPLNKRRHIFGRQAVACDFVLDHPSVSRQHAAVVHHKNGSIFVIDLGSVHGTFVAHQRLTKDIPLEMEVGQSLRFAASTRTYILRKNAPKTLQVSQLPPPLVSPSAQNAVYNAALNQSNVWSFDSQKIIESHPSSGSHLEKERPDKKPRKSRLEEVVGASDSADSGTEPGPVGAREGSLIGKYESLVKVTVIPKGKGELKREAENSLPMAVTQKLQQCLKKVKSPAKGGPYEDLYGDIFPGQVGASWASSIKKDNNVSSATKVEKIVELTEPTEIVKKPEIQKDLSKHAGDPASINNDLFSDDNEEN